MSYQEEKLVIHPPISAGWVKFISISLNRQIFTGSDSGWMPGFASGALIHSVICYQCSYGRIRLRTEISSQAYPTLLQQKDEVNTIGILLDFQILLTNERIRQ